MKFFLPAFILFFLVTACSKDNKAITPDTGTVKLIPGETGNTWNYDLEQFDTNGVLITKSYYSVIVSEQVESFGEIWFIDNYFDSGLHRSTENRLYYKMNATVGAYWAQLGSTKQSSEIILDTIFGSSKEQVIAYGATQTINGYQAIKNLNKIYFDAASDKVNQYSEYYITPGLGIVQIDQYLSKSIEGGEPYYLVQRHKLNNYILH